MRKVLATVLASGLLLLASGALAGQLTPALQEALATAAPDQPVSVIVHLADQAPIAGIDQDLKARGATLQQRHEEIVLALQDAARGQDALAADLQSARASGEVVGFTRYWISNLMVVLATPRAIEDIAARSDVAWVEPNFSVELIEPVDAYPVREGLETDSRGIGTTPGIEAIRAREVWEILGIDGSGALIGSLDTGVDADHPALASRWRGTIAPSSECWLDVIGSDPSYPSDFNSHGTHTVGTMCGLAPDDTIGVAPGAMWIACNAIDQGVSSGFDNDVIEAYQWFADPDGDPGTNDDVPDVVQNSWGVMEGLGYPDCFDLWWSVIDNAEAAGVVVTWSAGNEGSAGLRSPADRATTPYNCFSVGSTIHSPPYTISSFSSRGPSTCPDIIDPELAIKPEVSAPGSDIYSSVPGGGYGYKSGTSMAGPHVAGVAALIRSAAPDMPVDLVKQIMMQTCVDLGNPGNDNTYGYGFIDAYEAVLAAMDGFGTVEGAVTNASFGDLPLGGAKVEIPDRGYVWTVSADGSYSGMAPEGVYEVVCSLDGFAPQQVTVEVFEDQVTVQDFALTDNAGPAISNVAAPVATPDTAGPYMVSAEVTDRSTVTGVDLYWRVGGGWQQVAMTGADEVYTGEIPGQSVHTSVEYYLAATDGAGLESTAPENAPATFYELVITESVYATAAEDPGDPEWTLGVAGDGASTGLWVRADPVGTSYNGEPMQTEDDHTIDPGVACYVTGNGTVGGEPGDADVDDGCTTLVTPVFDLSLATRAFVTYWRWWGQDGFTEDDEWLVEASNDGGATWVTFENFGDSRRYWQQVGVELGSLDGGNFALTDQVQLRFLACDTGGGGLIEAAIDDFDVLVYLGDTTPVEDAVPGIQAVQLRQNHPNPFNPATSITFALPRESDVELAVYALDGRRVATLAGGVMPAGEHTVNWDGRDTRGRRVASGAYFYRLSADGATHVKRMVMVK